MDYSEQRKLFVEEQFKKIRKALKKGKMDKALHHARAYVVFEHEVYSRTGLMEQWLVGRVLPEDLTDTFAFSFETDARAGYFLRYGQDPEDFDQLTSYIEFSMPELIAHGRFPEE